MSTRQEKVQRLLKVEISDILQKELRDPRLGFVTITDTEVTPDMRYAKIFFTVLGSEKEKNTNLKMLKHSAGFIRAELGKRINMRSIPALDFRFDESIENGVKMHELLEQLRRNEESRAKKDME